MTKKNDKILPVKHDALEKDNVLKLSDVNKQTYTDITSYHTSTKLTEYSVKASTPAPVSNSSPSAKGEVVPVKKSRIKRVVRPVVYSLRNTAYDHVVSPIVSLNTYHNHFLVSTYNGIKDICTHPYDDELWLRTEWIDIEEMPFRAIVNSIETDTEFNIEEGFSILKTTLVFATFLMFYALYNAVFSVTMTLYSFSWTGAINSLYWLVFFMLCVGMYIFYSFHCWILKRDKFGTFSMFIKDAKQLEASAVFPYL